MALLRGAQRISLPLLSNASLLVASSKRIDPSALWYSTASGSNSVTDLKTNAQYEHEMETLKESGKLGVVDFTAAWCGPCRSIAPVYNAMSTEFPEVKFYRVDIDSDPIRKTVEGCGISAVPTFKFVKGGQTVATITGADKAKIQELLAKHK